MVLHFKFRNGHVELFRSRLWSSFLYNATLYTTTTAIAAAASAAATATADTTNRSFIAQRFTNVLKIAKSDQKLIKITLNHLNVNTLKLQ